MHPRSLLLALALAPLLAHADGGRTRVPVAPPDPHDAPFVRAVLGAANTRWSAHATPHLHVHAPADTPVAGRLPALARAAEVARASNLRLLGAMSFAPRLELLFVGSRAAMRPFLGRTPGGWAEPMQAAVLLVASDSVRPPLRHELMHVLSWQLWGMPRSSWLSEGMAMHAVGRCHGYPLHAMAAALAVDDRLVPLAELPRRFVVEGEQGMAMYVQAGSLVRHVAETYGLARLRAFWSGGLSGVSQSLGVDVPTLERGWRRRLAAERVTTPWPTIARDVQQSGCE